MDRIPWRNNQDYIKEAFEKVLPSNILLNPKSMKTKTRKELLEDMKFQQMKRFLGIRHVRNYCSGCGEEIHEPVYCEDCLEEVERIKLKNEFK